MRRSACFLAGLVLFVVPLAAQQQPQQTPRLRNPAITKVPEPPAVRLNPKVLRPPEQSPPPSITIAFRNPVHVGEDVVVKLEMADVVIAAPYVFTVNFGDGTSMVIPPGRADVTHSYPRADSYIVSISVGRPDSIDAVVVPPPLVTNNGASISVVPIELGVSSTTPAAGDPVKFTTQFQSSDQNIRYRFTFDGMSTDWLTAPETSHAFATPGNHPTNFVEVGRALSGLPAVSVVAQSASVLIQVTAAAQTASPPPNLRPSPTPTPRVPTDGGGTGNRLPYVAAIVAALAIAAYSARHWLLSPRLTLEAHHDVAALNEVAGRQPLGIDVEIRLHRDVAAGEIRDGQGEAGLVTAVRRTRG
jgi:hypothetical protein